LTYPISDPMLVLRACQAAEPLEPGDPRRYDFAPLRHARVLPRLEKVFSGEPAASNYHHRVLCGHRGCGKSTELLQFKKWADENGFACVRIEVNVRLGHVELEFSDFFLLAATAAEAALKELGLKLPKAALRPILEWFGEITKIDEELKTSELALEAGAQLGGKAPFGLAALFGKFTSGIKAGSSHAVRVRQLLRNYPDRLIDLTNALLEKAHEALEKKTRPRGLVLLFDNLDRYEPEQIDRVLLRGSSLLEKLACHTLFVIPIDLEYKPLSGPLRDSYGPPVVLPMVPLREREHPWRETVEESGHLETAVAGMREALALRLQIEEIFEAPDDADRLVRMSGGCIRDLIHLVTLAFEMSEGDKLSTTGCDLAIRELRATYSRELASDHYQRLAEIAARKKVPRDELTQSLLFNRWALEYSDPKGGVWIDVHPLVIEIDEFREALNRQSSLGA
jgi:hypothetical protein